MILKYWSEEGLKCDIEERVILIGWDLYLPLTLDPWYYLCYFAINPFVHLVFPQAS